MDQSEITDPENDFRTQALIHDIECFIDELYSRTRDKSAVQQICNGREPDGEELGQEPERFVVEHFIKPVLETLGYDYLPQPRGLPGLGDSTPDFHLTNVDVPTILGEVKSPGNPKKARRESFEYLTEIDSRIAAGISTDGIVWTLHWAVGGNQPKWDENSHLGIPINRIRKERIGGGDHHKDRRQLRRELHSFVDSFGRRAIVDRADEFNGNPNSS